MSATAVVGHTRKSFKGAQRFRCTPTKRREAPSLLLPHRRPVSTRRTHARASEPRADSLQKEATAGTMVFEIKIAVDVVLAEDGLEFSC